MFRLALCCTLSDPCPLPERGRLLSPGEAESLRNGCPRSSDRSRLRPTNTLGRCNFRVSIRLVRGSFIPFSHFCPSRYPHLHSGVALHSRGES